MNERSGTPCPRCRRDNPPEDRFCGACGTSLTVGGQVVRRPEGSPSPANRAPLPGELKPVVKALAVGLATLAARAGLMWLRRRAEGPDRPSLPAAKGTEIAMPGHPVYRSFEEVHVWLREGDFESPIFAQRATMLFRTTNPTDWQR